MWRNARGDMWIEKKPFGKGSHLMLEHMLPNHKGELVYTSSLCKGPFEAQQPRSGLLLAKPRGTLPTLLTQGTPNREFIWVVPGTAMIVGGRVNKYDLASSQHDLDHSLSTWACLCFWCEHPRVVQRALTARVVSHQGRRPRKRCSRCGVALGLL